MKHELVELIEASIENGISLAMDLLEQFNRGDYDFGQDRMDKADVPMEEYNAVELEAKNRLHSDVVRSEVVASMLKKMETDADGLDTEKSFAELLEKRGDDGNLILDMEGMMGEMCRVVIPAIMQHGYEKYAASCLQWLSKCERNNTQWFVGQEVMPILEKMKESHSLKKEFCSKNSNTTKNAVAL